MKKKNIILLITFVVCFLIISGVAVVLLSEEQVQIIEEEPAKTAKKSLVDGDMSNVEETLSAQHIYENYRLKALRVAEQGSAYAIIFIIDNISEEVQAHQHISLNFLDSNKKLLNEITVEIPELQPGETKTLYQYGYSSSIYNAFDYTVSKVKEVSIPKSE